MNISYIGNHFIKNRQSRAFSEVYFVGNSSLLDYWQTQLIILSVDVHCQYLRAPNISFYYNYLINNSSPTSRMMDYLSIIRKCKSSSQKRVASIDSNLHGVLGIDQLQKHVQELALIRRCRHYIPISLNNHQINYYICFV